MSASISPDAGSPRPKVRRVRVAAGLAFVLALAVRLPFMNAGLFHADEVVLAESVEASISQHRLVPAVKGRYGAVLVAMAFYAPYRAVTGDPAERVLPFMGTAMGALLVAMVLLLATELTGDLLAGVFGAAFTAAGAIFLTSSSTGKENTPQMALVTVAFWLLARGASRDSSAARIAASLVFAFSLGVHESTVVLLPAYVFAAGWLELRAGGGARALGLSLGVLAAACVAPFSLAVLRELRRNIFEAGSNSAEFGGLVSPSLPFAVEDAAAGIGLAVLLLGLGGAAIAVRSWRENRLVALLPWPLAFLYFANVSAYTPRFLLHVVPPIVVLAGAGAAFVVRRIGGGRRVVAATAILLLACIPGIVKAYPLLVARAAHSGPKAMALLVRERTEPGSIVLCADDTGALRYYAPGRTLVTVRYGDVAVLARLANELRERAQTGVRIYAGEYAFSYDDSARFRRFMGSAFVPVAVGSVVNEWYYRAELSDQRFRDTLYRFDPR